VAQALDAKLLSMLEQFLGSPGTKPHSQVWEEEWRGSIRVAIFSDGPSGASTSPG
jgi:hypothetical protein